MATYEQELAKWEAERKHVWDASFDEYDDDDTAEVYKYEDAAAYADREVAAWERRYPRPEQLSPAQQYPERPPSWKTLLRAMSLEEVVGRVLAPDRIGCQELTYTGDGVKLSNGQSATLSQLKNMRKFSSCGKQGHPVDNAFGPIAGYMGVYHNGFLVIGGQTVTTAQLAAMVKRCEALAREPEVDLSKRWKVVFVNWMFNNVNYWVNRKDDISPFGIDRRQPKEGFATREEAEAYKCYADRAYGKQRQGKDSHIIMPYLATKLPEKRYQVWGRSINPIGDWFECDNGEATSKEDAERRLGIFKRREWSKDTTQYEIREVEVYE